MKQSGQRRAECVPQHGAAGLVADGALGRHGQVALHPLVGHRDILQRETRAITD